MDIECQTGSSVARFPGCCERRGKYLVYRIPEFRLGIGPVMSPVFSLGARSVLYKPVSSERAKSSFRAARALMKSERRRNARVAVQIPVVLRSPGLDGSMRVTTIDLSEGGMAVSMPNRRRPTGRCEIAVTLRGKEASLDIPL